MTPRGAREIGVGVVGLGFMGRMHVEAYRAAAAAGHANRLVAVADGDPARLTGEPASGGNLGEAGVERLFDPDQVRVTTSVEELLADGEVELVSICTPTDTHVDLAEVALAAGKHVLLEKPVALDVASVERLAAVAGKAPGACVPAMCLRFWPAWSWLERAIAKGELGTLRSLTLTRLGTRPAWNPGFYGDPARSGGALFDLHVHDADFVRWALGPPSAVTSTGDRDHLTTLYRYEEQGAPVHVTAEGGWDQAAGFAFRMAYVAMFEGGTADYLLGRDPELLLARDGRSSAVELPALTGYDGEVRHVLDALARGRAPGPTLAEALALTRMLEAEARSLERRETVAL